MRKVRLAFLWHMHQPPYREATSGAVLLPWVRLHATRSYRDMAWILERHPGVRCTVNFTPVLLEQLEDAAAGGVSDRFLELGQRDPADLALDERALLLRSFFMVDWEHHVRPVPRYAELLSKRGRELRGVDVNALARTFGDAELTDLQVHFNLAWMGFSALADDEGLRALAAKGRDFGREDVAYVLAAQQRIVAEIVPRWRALAERGQVELSTTPYYHPILPLVCDTDVARRALPDAHLPPRFAWPEDARWQVAEAITSHTRRFGRPPAGAWPAEGSVSPEAVALLAEAGLSWAASDEGVLLASLPGHAGRLSSLYRPWRVAAGPSASGPDRELAMLFRDRSLSDLVGFTYQKVPAREAVADLLGHVASIGEAWEGAGLAGEATVGVFLDGENAWEHYPRSGHDFLDGLWGALEADPRFETVTMSEATAPARARGVPAAGAREAAGLVERIHSGSWIESSFRIWMGHSEDRAAWGVLGEARRAVADAEREGRVPPESIAAAKRHLYQAEASDWFWWYGEDFTSELAAEFDGLFRGHVVRAALLVGAAPPPAAQEPLKRAGTAHPTGVEAKPLLEPTVLLTPVLDGRETTYFEWQGAGLYRPGQHRGSMFGGAQAFNALRYGFDVSNLYLRLDPAESPTRAAEVATVLRLVVLSQAAQAWIDFDVAPGGGVRPGRRGSAEVGRSAMEEVLELGVPFAGLGLAPGAKLAIAVHALRGDVEVERLPRFGYVNLVVPDADFERLHWRV